MGSSYRFEVDGRVQGVGFRQTSAVTARRLAVKGWIRNREDGCVEGIACGSEAALQAFRNWLDHGPTAARVNAVRWQPLSESASMPESFEIRR